MKKQFLAVMVSGLFATTSMAVVNTWTGLAGDGLWGSAGNWSLGHVPIADTEDVTIGNGFGTINLGINRGVAGVTVNLGASALTGADLITSQFTTVNANGTVFSGSTIMNPFGSATGDVTLNNVTHVANGTWGASENHAINVNGGSIVLGGVLRMRGSSGQSGIVNINGGGGYYSLVAVNADNAAADQGPTAFNVSGGAYVASGLTYVGLAGGGTGTFSLAGSTFEQQGGTMTLAAQSQFISQYGTIVLRGTLANSMTSSSQWNGYLTTAMQDFGGTISYEVSGTDLGAATNITTATGANFSMARLYFGSAANPQSIQLTDNFNNDGVVGAEALYVDTLELLNNTTLDLNGLNLYYKDFQSHGFTLTLQGGGAFIQAVPEPTAGLLVIVTAALLRRRR